MGTGSCNETTGLVNCNKRMQSRLEIAGGLYILSTLDQHYGVIKMCVLLLLLNYIF